MLAFVLFVILGWQVFVPGAPRTVLMVIFIVLLALWLLLGFGALSIPYAGSRW